MEPTRPARHRLDTPPAPRLPPAAPSVSCRFPASGEGEEACFAQALLDLLDLFLSTDEGGDLLGQIGLAARAAEGR